MIDFFPICFAANLSKNLKYYEAMHADDVVHKIVKRGATHSTHPFNTIKEVEFKVLGRHFRIILHPQRDVLHSNFKAYSVDADGHEKVIHFGEFFFSIIPRFAPRHYHFALFLMQITKISTVDDSLVRLNHLFALTSMIR